MLDVAILEPESLEEAFALLDEWGDDAKIIAGGTAMVLMLKNGLIAPAAMVSLGRIPGLDGIGREPGQGLRIGALATLRRAELSPVVRGLSPTLADTFGTVANVRVRNVATVGGNMAEADYASDPPSMLVAMGASVTARTGRGERSIPLDDFFVDYYQTALEPGEIVTELAVPEPSPNTQSAYLKFVTRSSEDRPCVGVAAVVEVEDDGSCRSLRVVVGAVAGKPQEVPAAEGLAAGRSLDAGVIGEVADAYAEAIDPIDDLRGSTWYRTRVIRVFVRRALERALGPGGGVKL